MVDQEGGQARASPQWSDGPVDHRDELETVPQESRGHTGNGIEQDSDIGDNARLRVYARLLGWRAAAMPQALDRAPQEQRLETPHVVRVLVTHENVTDMVGRESARQYLADNVHSVAGVEENPSALGVVSPCEQ
jgi:hypothetical protein